MEDRQKNIIQLALRSDSSYACCNDDCILTLPTTDEQLRAVRDRLGVKTFGECEIMWVDSPLRVLGEIQYNGDIVLINDIAKAAIKAIEQEDDFALLLAVLDVYKNEDVYELKEHIEHLDSYELLPECSYEEYGERIFFQLPSAPRVDDTMIPYIDFEKYGIAMMEKNDVRVTNMGWLCPKADSFKYYVPLVGRTENRQELNAGKLVLCQQEIADRLDFDVKRHLPPSGLIADSKLPDAVKNKILSVIPSVETRNDELWGCLQITKQGWITEKELSAISVEWYNQLKFGWGDHFRTQGIRSGDGTLYIDFWHESNDYRFFSEKEMAELEQQTGRLDDSSQTGGMRL